MTALDWILAACLAVPAYAWLVYPPLLLRLARRRTGMQLEGERPREPQPAAAMPRVSVLVAAYNEEAGIAARIRNVLSSDYPADRLRVLVGVDGATDNTARAAQAAAEGDPRVEVHAFNANRGKVSVLKDLVPMAQSADLLVFTDANTEFDRDALARLAAPFADPDVGGVCGKLIFVEADAGARRVPSEGAYWRWENRLKEAESALDSCLGANGAIYAIRPNLFWKEIPANTIVDDFVIGMKVRERGARMLYEPGAVAREELPDTVHEWRRRVRIGAGDYQSLWLCRGCLHPRFGRFAWAFWSHKVLRWFTPHLFALALALLTMRLARGAEPSFPGWWLALTGAALGGLAILMAVAGRMMPRGGGPAGALFRLSDHFLTMQAALLAGFLRFCAGGLEGRWQRTPRG
jgi:cellulose synthase/poly-beta-1,6-N-acetylglucosamine synthase-like glycosyltransferase